MWKITTTNRLVLPRIGSLLLNFTKSMSPSLVTTNLKMSTTNKVVSPKRQRIEGQPATIGTHSGTFHCDEVLACFMLKQLPEYKDAQIFRSRNDTELQEKCDIIVDVGGEFDHEKKWYDHHQKSFQGTLSSLRPEVGEAFNKIRLSSAGLIFCFYGERVIDEILKKHANVSLTPNNLKLTFVQIYRNFISEIDAIDNGVPMCPEGVEPLYKISTGLSSRVGKFNPSWEEEQGSNIDVDERFAEAMTYAGKEFVDNVVAIGGSWIKAREYVREALVTAKSIYESGEILMLPRFCPWKQHLVELEKEYDVEGIPKLVIFTDTSGSWRVAGVPENPDSFLGRKFLPVEWRGLRDDELSKLAGIDGLVFVHHTGFIGGAKSKEAAIEMAIKSVQWKD